MQPSLMVGAFVAVATRSLLASSPYTYTVTHIYTAEAFTPMNNNYCNCPAFLRPTASAFCCNRRQHASPMHQLHYTTDNADNEIDGQQTATASEEWTSLTEDGGVKMRIVSSSSAEASGDSPASPVVGKDDVTVEYTGTLLSRNWTVDDVIACWLPDQGLKTDLAPKLFAAFEIDGLKLLNKNKFNRKFIYEGLGVLKESKIQNLLKAADSLQEFDESHPAGTVFDKNRFTFRLGKNMAISGFELAIPKMRMGDTVTLIVRADYAYGSAGLRRMGKYDVPPYATVSFDLNLVDIK